MQINFKINTLDTSTYVTALVLSLFSTVRRLKTENQKVSLISTNCRSASAKMSHGILSLSLVC